MEPQNQKNSCTKGCCKKPAQQQPSQPAQHFEPPLAAERSPKVEREHPLEGEFPEKQTVLADFEQKKKVCAKGCCKEGAQQTSELILTLEEEPPKPERDHPPEEEVGRADLQGQEQQKKACAKGCCKGKEEPKKEISPELEAVQPEQLQDAGKKSCAKGCCKKPAQQASELVLTLEEEPVKPERDHPPEEQVMRAALQGLEGQKREACSKGCCGEEAKRASSGLKQEGSLEAGAAPPQPEEAQELSKKACTTGCCKDPSTPIVPEEPSVPPFRKLFECCSRCWGAGSECCASNCCKVICCVVASVLPKKRREVAKKQRDRRKRPTKDDVELLQKEVQAQTSQFVVEGIDCSDCAVLIDKHLRGIPEVREVAVRVTTSLVTVSYVPSSGCNEAFLLQKLAEIGHPGESSSPGSVEVVFAGVQRLTDLRPIVALLASHPAIKDLRLVSPQKPNTLSIAFEPSIASARLLLQFMEANGFLCRLVDPPKPGHAAVKEIRYWGRAALLSTLFAIPVFVIDFFLTEKEPLQRVLTPGLTVSTLISWILSTPIQFYFCNRLYGSAWRSLVFSRRPNMDVLVVLSTLTAYLYSMGATIAGMAGAKTQGEIFFSASAILLALIAIGRFLEATAKGRAVKLLSSLLSLQPNTVRFVQEDGKTESDIDVRLVQAGDLLKCLPGSRVATDGVIESGEASVDEAMLTGESLPVSKLPGDPLYAGTLNLSGMVLYRSKGTVSENSVSQLVNLVQSAENSKPKVARFADLAAAYFTPIALAIATIVFVVWASVAATGAVGSENQGGSAFPFALHFALAVLVVSCPCALALAAPVCVTVGSSVASRLNILIKGGEAIEKSHGVDTVVFDKTGTITTGRPEISALFPADPGLQAQFMELAASAELGSEHVLATVVVNWAKAHQLPLSQPTGVQTVPGLGIQATVSGQTVAVGSQRWLATCQVPIPGEYLAFQTRMSSSGSTIVFVAIDGACSGAIAFADQLKPEASAVVHALQADGRSVWLLSGDNRFAATSIARQVGIPESNVVAEASPAAKIAHVQQLQEAGHTVMMIGDGINDAPALTQADIGVAVGAGTDITQHSAQIVLARNNLNDLIVTLHLCRVIYRRIQLNIAWAFLYNIIAIPLAAGVLYPIGFSIPPAFAGISELLSSVPVLVFSLCLIFYRPPPLPYRE